MINYPKSVFFYFWSENPPKFAKNYCEKYDIVVSSLQPQKCRNNPKNVIF